MRHKADVREIEGPQWFNKICPSERFTAVVWDKGAKAGLRKKCIATGEAALWMPTRQRQLGASWAWTISTCWGGS